MPVCPVQERVHCHRCSVATHEHEYVQYFYNVMATGIGEQERLTPGQPLGFMLNELEGQSLKSCDDEKGMYLICVHTKNHRQNLLLSFASEFPVLACTTSQIWGRACKQSAATLD